MTQPLRGREVILLRVLSLRANLRSVPIVRDDPERPDPAFAALYARLGEATDLEPWLSWARDAGGPVLYLGVGAGRLALPLRRAGVRLVGVDAHPGMLEALATQLASDDPLLPGMELISSRIEDLDLPRRFPLAIAPSNILYTQERLRGAARHLNPGGRLGFELTNPHWLHGGPHKGVRVIEMTPHRAWIEIDYDAANTQQAAFELVWPEAIESWLAQARLTLVSMGGDGEGLTDSSTFHVLAAR